MSIKKSKSGNVWSTDPKLATIFNDIRDRKRSKWNLKLEGYNLDKLSEDNPAIQEKLEELMVLIKLCQK